MHHTDYHLSCPAGITSDDFNDKPFYQQRMEFATYRILRLLKNCAPGAWILVGLADVHKYLQEGEIFACIKPLDKGILSSRAGRNLLIAHDPSSLRRCSVYACHRSSPSGVGSCFLRGASLYCCLSVPGRYHLISVCHACQSDL